MLPSAWTSLTTASVCVCVCAAAGTAKVYTVVPFICVSSPRLRKTTHDSFGARIKEYFLNAADNDAVAAAAQDFSENGTITMSYSVAVRQMQSEYWYTEWSSSSAPPPCAAYMCHASSTQCPAFSEGVGESNCVEEAL